MEPQVFTEKIKEDLNMRFKTRHRAIFPIVVAIVSGFIMSEALAGPEEDANMLRRVARKIRSLGTRAYYKKLASTLELAADILLVPLESRPLFQDILKTIVNGKVACLAFENLKAKYRRYEQNFEFLKNYLSLQKDEKIEKASKVLAKVLEMEVVDFQKWKNYFRKVGDQKQVAFTMLALLCYNEYSKKPVSQFILAGQYFAPLRKIFFDPRTPEWERGVVKVGMAAILVGGAIDLGQCCGLCEDYVPQINQDLESEILKRSRDLKWIGVCIKTYVEVLELGEQFHGGVTEEMSLIYQQLYRIHLHGCDDADRAKAKEYWVKCFQKGDESVPEDIRDEVIAFVTLSQLRMSVIDKENRGIKVSVPPPKKRRVVTDELSSVTFPSQELLKMQDVEGKQIGINMPRIQGQITEAGYYIEDVLGDGNCGIYAVLKTLTPTENYESIAAMKDAAKQLRQRMFPAGSPLSLMVTNLGDREQRSRWLSLDDREARRSIVKVAKENGRSVVVINATYNPSLEVEDPVNHMFMRLDVEGNVTGYESFQDVLGDDRNNPMVLLYTSNHWQAVLKR